MPPRALGAHVVMFVLSVRAKAIARDQVEVPDINQQRHKDERATEQRVHDVLVAKAQQHALGSGPRSVGPGEEEREKREKKPWTSVNQVAV